MIPISRIDPELRFYRDKIVVLFGCGYYGQVIAKLLKIFDIEVSYFCDNDKNKWGGTISGVPIISPKKLKELNSEHENLLVQVSVDAYSDVAFSILSQLEELSVPEIISAKEGYGQLVNYSKLDRFQKNPELGEGILKLSKFPRRYDTINYEKSFNLVSLVDELPIFICMLGKVGNTTLQNTLSKYVLVQQTHLPTHFHKNIIGEKKIKIVTAIRDPISRDLSGLFQSLGTFDGYRSFFDIGHNFSEEAFNIYRSNDAQVYFDKFMQKNCCSVSHDWFSNFSKDVVDVMKYNFAKDEGYSIIHEDNYDIFIYQLEKLNDIVPQLSEWVGVPFDKLENANITAEKWISNSYKQAQKEIQITQEYFDMCYNSPYVKHFYSEEDIEKFKDRWRKHIKK